MTKEQENALREYLQESIVPLIEQVLVKKLGQAMTFAAEQLINPKHKLLALTDEELISVYESEQQGRFGDHVRGLRAVEQSSFRRENHE